MNRIDRLFGILTLLQSRKYVTAEKIAEKFSISVRTVYRDIKALGEQGIPVSFEQPKGYYIVQGYFLPPVSFNPEEANALVLIEGLVKGLSDRSIQQRYSNALNKVKAVMGSAQKDKLEILSGNIKMQLPECMNYDFEYLSRLQVAISNKTTIELDYCNSQGQASKRSVEPIGLIFYAMSWHLIAWCRLRNEYRDFKVSRIVKLRNTEQPFVKTEHLPLKDYMTMLPVTY